MALTPEYKQMLVDEHARRAAHKKWGTTGARNAGWDIVRWLTGRGDVHTVLDFGAGQGSLGKFVLKHLPYLEWHEYDPGRPGIDKLPERSYDFIVSSDVMEHVEPDMLGETILWQQSHADKGMFHHIACDPCGLILPDGRNAHLITEKLPFWRHAYADPGWALMFEAQCSQLKRGMMRDHCILVLDKL